MMPQVSPKNPQPHRLFFMVTWGNVCSRKIEFLPHFYNNFAPIGIFIPKNNQFDRKMGSKNRKYLPHR
jgi:hypothetical protein